VSGDPKAQRRAYCDRNGHEWPKRGDGPCFDCGAERNPWIELGEQYLIAAALTALHTTPKAEAS
jgi:hypothetical protein